MRTWGAKGQKAPWTGPRHSAHYCWLVFKIYIYIGSTKNGIYNEPLQKLQIVIAIIKASLYQ